MMWVDYTIDSIPGGKGFKVRGDGEGEVMDIALDGTYQAHYLYKPGDVFVVNEHGWLRKSDELMVFIQKGLQSPNSK